MGLSWVWLRIAVLLAVDWRKPNVRHGSRSPELVWEVREKRDESFQGV